MSRRLELIREEKLLRLLPGRTKRTRLEASGAALVDDSTALVKRQPRHALLPAPSLGSGFEDVCIDHRDRRVFCLVETLEDFDGQLRGFVAEYDDSGRFIRCTRLWQGQIRGVWRAGSFLVSVPAHRQVARRTYREPAYN